MRFEAFSFGSICINGTTYGYDVVIDRGRIRKRKKKPSKRFRDQFGHTPRSALPQNQIGHTTDNRSCQGAAGKPRGDQCGPARYMLEVESDPKLENALDR